MTDSGIINRITNHVKTDYFIGTNGLLVLLVFTPIAIAISMLQLFIVLDTMPEYFTFYFWFFIMFPIFWSLFICWIASLFLIVIVKNKKVILLGVGRINVLTPMNVEYFEKTNSYPGPNKDIQPDTLLKYAVLINGKRVALFRIAISLDRQKKLESILIESIGAPIK